MRRLLLASAPLACLLTLGAVPARAQEPATFEACGASYRMDSSGFEPTGTGWRFTGPVRILCDDFSLDVDGELETVDLEDGTRVIHARARRRGGVLFVQEDLRIWADRMEINSRTKYGTFYEAAGHARIDAPAEKSQFGTQEPAVDFWADRLERTGPRTYRVINAGFTTCGQPTPRWQIGGSTGTVTLDDHVTLSNAVLKVKNVPLFYLPWMRYPISDRDRSTGFLIPTYSTSSVRGTGLSNAFFLVMGRSQDATFFHDWFSTSGQGLGSEYRYIAAPGSEGNVRFYMLDEADRFGADGVTLERAARRSYDLRGNVNQGLFGDFRLIGRANYYTDSSTRQLYNQNVFDFSQRERYYGVTVTGTLGRVRLSSTAEQRDFFYGIDSAQRRGQLPSVSASLGQRTLGRSRVYVGASGQIGHYLRRDDLKDPATDHSLWRIDASPSVRVPLSTLPFLSVTGTASWRFTRWLESLDPETSAQVQVPITRQLVEFGASVVGPVFSRVWQTPDSGYAQRFKHLIEPSFTISWLSPFDELDRVVKIDGTDYLVGGTTTVTYGVTNRLLARREAGVRDILSVGISQTYYSNQLAAAFDGRYQSATGATSFSPVRINVDAKPSDRFTARFNTEIDADFRKPRQYAASAWLRGSRVQVSGGWSKRQVIPGLPGYDNPAFASHFLNASTTIRSASGAYGGTYGFNFDLLNTTMLQQRVMAYYNAQCCGIQVDYQTVSIARFGLSGIPADRRFGISFTLAGIGSFANPLGSFGDGR